MTPRVKDWIGVVVVTLLGAAMVAGIGSGQRSFWVVFIYATLGLATVTTSMIATLVLVVPSKSRDDTRLLVGALIGLFVTTPLALSLAFYLLDKALPW
jgi:hypothetical protein